MHSYEAVVIVDPTLDEAATKQAVDRFTKLIESKGEVSNLDQWGRRRLAYEIGHHGEGYYVVAKFRAEPSLIAELDRLFEIAEEYVRAKIVRV